VTGLAIADCFPAEVRSYIGMATAGVLCPWEAPAGLAAVSPSVLPTKAARQLSVNDPGMLACSAMIG